ncbi:tRNA glutamyl-Q(34) synthetase GluQRS [Sphingomonas sp. DBB INV C78]|uniref:tRNA glutamyl-Q(34) synthetase GluQRS n=1 Tax=Sphingomonas sp. DBB INV C78 TaxID=3349434 RepID=UPI0036D26AB6
MSEIISRFAPSPTGQLHLGHAFSAIRAYDLARTNNGRFLLRIEDIDPGRTREEHVAGILADLEWLGLGWDGEVVRQSDRLHLYAAALERLKVERLVYTCFCTRAEIAASAAAPHGDENPIYPGTCRHIDPTRRAERMTTEPYAWRIDMAAATQQARPLDWWDETAGSVRAVPERQGDVVLARKDAPVSYHLAVTIDDAAQGVTDVVRGEDLFAATHIHRLLQALLGLPTPLYHHHPLLMGPDGKRLAKRDGAPALAELRAQGADGLAIAQELRQGIIPAGFSAGKA